MLVVAFCKKNVSEYFTNTTGISFTDKDIKEFKLKCLPKYKLHGDGSYSKIKEGLFDQIK